MSKRDTKTLSRRWFNKADNIWLYAKAGYKSTGLTAPFCFDCQQVAELYLKGFLVLNNIKPPKTHHLPKLLQLCIKKDKQFNNLVYECSTLTTYYIPSRYPTFPFPEYSIDEAQEAKEAVEKIIDFVTATR